LLSISDAVASWRAAESAARSRPGRR